MVKLTVNATSLHLWLFIETFVQEINLKAKLNELKLLPKHMLSWPLYDLALFLF